MGRKAKINEQELILMLGQGLTHQAIADEFGVSRAAVSKKIATLPPSLREHKSLEMFKKTRADRFAELQQMLLRFITPDKLAKASLAQIGTLFGIFYDKERLEQNLATEHVAHAHLAQLSEVDRKALKDAVVKMTQTQLDEARKSHGVIEADYVEVDNIGEQDAEKEGVQDTERDNSGGAGE